MLFRSNQSAERLNIAYQSGGSLIKGSIEIYGNKYIELSNTKSSLKNIMSSWVKYLFACADGKRELDFHFVFKNKNDEPRVLSVLRSRMSDDFIRETVEKLTAYFKEGHTRLFPFLPLLGYAFYAVSKNTQPVRVLYRDDIYERFETFNEQEADKKYDEIGRAHV